MTKKPGPKPDPIEREIEQVLKPGALIPDRACFELVSKLERVAAKVAQLTSTDPARAIGLDETLLAACYEKAEELDDSSGSFGQFVGELFCGWIEARQAAGADPDETVKRLLGWMDDDPYGFCYRLEKDAAQAGLTAFEQRVRARFDAAANPAPEATFRDRPEYLRRRWGEVLRTVYLAQSDIAAYLSLAEQTGLTAQDCHAIAGLLLTRGQAQQALAWVEGGIDRDRKAPHVSLAGHDLAKLKRELLILLGRGDEALEAAWAAYGKHPSRYTYDDLMKLVPEAERSTWHKRAIEAARGAVSYALIELLLEAAELERLAALVRACEDAALEALSHYATEPAAKALEKTHPDVAARLWRAQGMRIVNAKKSKYYDAALSCFERAMHCFEKAGLASEWEKTVSQVRSEHHRKTGFMSGFEALAAGSGPGDKPSFLERAKARWGARNGGSTS